MHRRHRSYAGTLTNEELYSTSVPGHDAQRPNSAPTSSNVPRPGLIARAASLKSRRNILHDGSSSNAVGNNLGDYLGVDGNAIVLPNETTGDGSLLSKSVSSDSSAPCRNTGAGSSRANNGSPARRQQAIKPPNHWTLRRQPDFFSRSRRISWESAEVSESSASVRERAFQVAMSFKNNDNSTGYTSSLGERNEGELSDLLNRVEAIRENEEGSRGSGTRNSKGSVDHVQSPRDSWSKSTGSHDRERPLQFVDGRIEWLLVHEKGAYSWSCASSTAKLLYGHFDPPGRRFWRTVKHRHVISGGGTRSRTMSDSRGRRNRRLQAHSTCWRKCSISH
jgi:hypothetical protein